MLSDEAAADNWKAWLDDLPLDAGFAEGIEQVQDFISGTVARADRAEAALAAQIEAEPVAWVIPGDDNEDCNGFIDAMAYEDGEFTRPLYAAQPHSRTALDAAIRAAKVEALRKAEAATLGLATGRECQLSIRAMIEREVSHD